MLETMTLLAFILTLLLCLISGASTLYALTAGYFIFCAYGLKRGHRVTELLEMSLSGVKKVKNILMIFGLIGMLTALWRGAGTIPVIVCYCAALIRPSAFILITFLLNCLLSGLTGTSFGTAATIGVICMAMARALGLSPFYVGGAILSGVFFGDRCSPVSSSAHLVCELTGTDIYENIRGMVKTSLVPFALSCAVYYVMGLFMAGGNEIMDVESLFSGSFYLHWSAVLPAAAILLLALFRVEVKRAMTVSILLALALCGWLQNMGAGEIARSLIFGYRAADPGISSMIDGGGILSMVRVTVIVSLSSCYAGIFEGTGLLKNMKEKIEALGQRLTSYGVTLLVGVVTSMIACNQTLATILTCQLCRETEPDSKKFAVNLENTVILLAALVPWSIAGAVPLATVGAPATSALAACYVYLVPLWNLLVALCRRPASSSGRQGVH